MTIAMDDATKPARTRNCGSASCSLNPIAIPAASATKMIVPPTSKESHNPYSAKFATTTSAPIEKPARTTKTASMRPRRTSSRSIGNDSSLWGRELDPEHALDDRRVVNAVDERRVDDWVIVTPEGDIQALELGRLRRAEDRRISPDERGGVRPDDVSDARREETARYDEDRGALLRERASVREVVHVEPVRNMHDVDCDARRIPELEQHADGHVLIRRRDCRDRDIVVADVSGDLHPRVARGNVPVHEVHPRDRADHRENREEHRRGLCEPCHLGGPPPGMAAATGGAPEDNPTSPAKWHSAKWPGTISRNSGFVVLQISCAYGQRGWNVHPVGRSIGLGSSPWIFARPRWNFGSGTGTDVRSACVYGCSGFEMTSSPTTSSTIRPRYMTAIRSDMYRVTPTSWEMNTRVSRNSSRSWSRRFMTPARIETSSMDTGSSATMNSGWRTIARAIATRCRCPPLSSCGYRYMKSDAGASSACSSAFAIRSSRSSRESVMPCTVSGSATASITVNRGLSDS